MKKVRFDPNNVEHLNWFDKYLQTDSWAHTGGCPFALQKPWVSVPHMIQSIITNKFLDQKFRNINVG